MIRRIPRINSLTFQYRRVSFLPRLSDFKLKPQPPGDVAGTVNDASTFPVPDHLHGSYHWSYERLLAISMVPLAITPFVAGVEHPMVDSLLSVGLMFHCQIGFQSCIIDYIPKRVYGIWHTIAMRLLDAGTVVGLYGVYLLETDSNGLFDLISRMWVA